MADECTDVATIEQMALCIRCVGNTGEDFEVREDFIGFVDLEKTDAESISSGIVYYLHKCELDLNYDGASVMSGKVSARIQEIEYYSASRFISPLSWSCLKSSSVFVLWRSA